MERTPDLEHDADLRRLVTTGVPLRDKLRDILHGTADREDYPRDQGHAWLKEAIQHRKRLAAQMIEADFAGWNAVEQSQLLRTGAAAPATVVDVSDTGMSINDDPRTVFYDPGDLSRFTFKNDDVVDGDEAPA